MSSHIQKHPTPAATLSPFHQVQKGFAHASESSLALMLPKHLICSFFSPVVILCFPKSKIVATLFNILLSFFTCGENTLLNPTLSLFCFSMTEDHASSLPTTNVYLTHCTGGLLPSDQPTWADVILQRTESHHILTFTQELCYVTPFPGEKHGEGSIHLHK